MLTHAMRTACCRREAFVGASLMTLPAIKYVSLASTLARYPLPPPPSTPDSTAHHKKKNTMKATLIAR